MALLKGVRLREKKIARVSVRENKEKQAERVKEWEREREQGIEMIG